MTDPVGETIDLHVEIYYDGQWNEIPQDDLAFDEKEVTVNYGRPDLHGSTVPTTIEYALDNRTSRYSPLDYRSDLSGKIGLGTLTRVRIGDHQTAGLSLPGHRDGYAVTGDTPGLGITGDIDIRIEVEPDTWRPRAYSQQAASADFPVLARKDTGGYPVVDQQSWNWLLRPTGAMIFIWSSTGANQFSMSSNAVIPEDSGRLALRVTLDVNNGAAGRTARFYTAPTIAGPWTQLGTDVVAAGTTSIFDSSSDLEIGRGAYQFDAFNIRGFRGSVYAFQLRNGIDGTVVGSVDFEATTIDPADREYVSPVDARTYTLSGGAAFIDASVRGTCAISSFTPSWDVTGLNAVMNIMAHGPLEDQSEEDPLDSAMYRSITGISLLHEYWPLEDGSSSTTFASAISGRSSATLKGDVLPASFSDFTASSPLPVINSDANNPYILAIVKPYTAATRQRVFFVCRLPDSGVSVNSRLATLKSNGSVPSWQIDVNTGGQFRVIATDSSGTQVSNTGFLGASANGAVVMCSLTTDTTGADFSYRFDSMIEGESTISTLSGTLAGNTVGRWVTFQLGPSTVLSGTAFGHLGLIVGQTLSNVALEFFYFFQDGLIAWDGDTAGDRLGRISSEENLSIEMDGGHFSEKIGPQQPAPLVTLFDEASRADMAIFGERRSAFGFFARFRTTLFGQAPRLTLDMAEGHIANPFDAPLDTDGVYNDVTVSRANGSSYRAVAETGPLSLEAAPVGLGRRRRAPDTSLALHEDSQVREQAAWRLALGTTNEHRVSTLELELEHAPELVADYLALRMGDIVQINSPIAGLPSTPIQLMALGTTDVITPITWRAKINCSPGAVWVNTATISSGTDEQRVDTEGSFVWPDFTVGSTSMYVATYEGPKWTTSVGEFPFSVTAGGVQLNVTNIQNIDVANPGFEVDASNWTGVTASITRSTAQAHSGSASGLHVPDALGPISRSRTTPVNVAPGLPYRLRAWVRSVTGHQVDISVEFFDADGVTVEFVVWKTITPAANTWVELDHTQSSPATAVTAACYINQRTPAPTVSDQLYIDDVSFTGPLQQFTVDSDAVNGEAGTILARGDVRLTHPAIIGMWGPRA